MDSPNNSTKTAASDDDFDSRAAAESLPLSPFFPDPIQRPPFSDMPWSRSEPDLLIPSQTRPTVDASARNPKKRARASRRAPTTVLTTDTTNFRAMVQEFTGIPEPPFTSRTRFHLFPNPNPNTSSSSYSVLSPFPHTPPLSNSSTQFLSSSSSSVLPPFPSTSSLLLPSHYSNTTITSSNTSNFYQLSSDLGLLKHNTNINNNNLPLFRMGGFGLNHHVHGSSGDTNVVGGSGLHNMVSTSTGRVAANNDDGDAGGVLVSSANFVNNNDSEPTVSTTNNGGKGAEECVSARTQGMVESWINCSSH